MASKDNSEFSKLVIKYIESDNRRSATFKQFSKEQKETLRKGLPKKLVSYKNVERWKNAIFKDTTTGYSYKVNANNAKKKVPKMGSKAKNLFAPIGWQISIKNVLKNFDYTYDNLLTSTQNFKRYFKEDTRNKLRLYVDWLFKSFTEIDEYVIVNNGIESIDVFKTIGFDFSLASSNIDSDMFEQGAIENKSTYTIFIEGSPIIEIQVGLTRNDNEHIARFNLPLLREYYTKVVQSTEAWGNSVEIALCDIYNIPRPEEYNKKRYDEQFVAQARKVIEDNRARLNIPDLKDCLATKRQGQKKSITDFISVDGKNLSVKSNYNGGRMVCPPTIGQPGYENGLKYYNKIFNSSFSKEEFKKDIVEFKYMFQNNIKEIVETQLEMLFSEDYILYLREDKGSYEIELIDTEVKKYNFSGRFEFTTTPEHWNYSTSIHYEGKTIAEMALHTNRTPFKFRFNLKNLLEVLKSMKNATT